MKKRRLLSCFLAAMVLLLSVVCVSAAPFAPYSVGRFTLEADAETFVSSNNTFALEKGAEVKISGVFTPTSAKLNVGILDSSTGVFYSQLAIDGKIDVTITALKRGDYYLAFRNNSDDVVSITGFIS